MEKRINILFDHLNNEDLLRPDTVQTMVEISRCVQNKDWDRAQSEFTEMQKTKGESEGGVWMVSQRNSVVSVGNKYANVSISRLVSSASLLLVGLQKVR